MVKDGRGVDVGLIKTPDGIYQSASAPVVVVIPQGSVSVDDLRSIQPHLEMTRPSQ
jgi:hypothetical protein